MTQTNIFENIEVKKSSPAALAISTQAKKTLSKQQQSFNKLIKKIEKLRLELVQLDKALNDKLEFYVKHILPSSKS